MVDHYGAEIQYRTAMRAASDRAWECVVGLYHVGRTVILSFRNPKFGADVVVQILGRGDN